MTATKVDLLGFTRLPNDEFGIRVSQILSPSVLTGQENLPKFNSIDLLLFESRAVVNSRWKSGISPQLPKLLSQISKNLDISNPKTPDIIKVLKDVRNMETKLRIRQFSDLDPLRKINPEAWSKLYRLSLERQMAEILVFQNFITLADEQQLLDSGMNRTELLLACEIALATYPLVNDIFIEQMQLADRPGGSDRIPNSKRAGSHYVWEEKTPDGNYERKPYVERFSRWAELVETLYVLSDRTTTLVNEGQLPKSYSHLANYLGKIAELFGSGETDFRKISKLWTDIFKAGVEYAKSGCPINIDVSDYAYVMGEMNKLDADLRVGIQTRANREVEASMKDYLDIASEFGQDYNPFLGKKYRPPLLRFAQMLSGPGSNIFWRTQGEATVEMINCYQDATADVLENMSLPFFEKIFGYRPSREKTASLLNWDYVLLTTHELGHGIAVSTDRLVKARIGKVGQEINIIEELKADTLSMKINWERMRREGNFSDAKEILETLIVMCLDYVVNRDSKDGIGTGMYARSGRIILSSLLQHGVLVRHGNIYELADVDEGFNQLIKLGDEICKIYTSDSTTPEFLKGHVQSLLNLAQTDDLEELIATVQERKPYQKRIKQWRREKLALDMQPA